MIQIMVKLKTIVIILINTGAEHSICNLKYSIPKEIFVIFHNRLNYDYHFAITELVKVFKQGFDCVEKNTEKYNTFSFLVTKEVKKIDKS